MPNSDFTPPTAATADPLRGLKPADLLGVGLATEVPGTMDGEDAPTPAVIAEEFPALEVLELLGRGGMGAVYKARQRALERVVSLRSFGPGSIPIRGLESA